MAEPLGPYPSPEARVSRTRAAARCAGAELRVFGHSVEGRELVAIDLPGPSAQAPTVLVVANIHGPEFISSQLALSVAEQAGQAGTELADLRRVAAVCVVPCLNPDGYARTFEAGGQGKLASLRANARGVDLNRNFPLPQGARRWPIPGAGSARPGAATYRGPSALSEPETKALAELAGELRPHLTFGLHSFMGSLIPARVSTSNHYKKYAELCREIKAAQPLWPYRRIAAQHLDVFTGEQEDYLHHRLDSWAICLETFSVRESLRQHLRSPSLFWRFNPRDPQPWIDNDLCAIAAGARAALATPRPSEL